VGFSVTGSATNILGSRETTTIFRRTSTSMSSFSQIGSTTAPRTLGDAGSVTS
jgi:hypothetical protein